MNIQDIASASALIKQELEPLAQKIGQGAEYTFGLFVKQAYVNAFTGLLWTIPGIIFMVIGTILLKKDINREFEDDNLTGFGYFVGSVLISLSFVCILVPITQLIQMLINPEYQAINLILETFVKK